MGDKVKTELDDGIIRGRGIELTDSNGRLRISLAVHNDEPSIEVIDPDGFPRISIRLYGDSPSIAFMSSEGHPWFSIQENKDRDSFNMVFFNRRNAPALWAEMPAKSPALLVMFDENGNELWRAPTSGLGDEPNAPRP